jgi:hypothetical protein
MILTAHQPVYLPWLGLFHKIAMADAFVSFNQVQYLPKDWNNRNKIKTHSGPSWLTVPVLKSGHRDKKLTEIEINSSINWQRKHWKTMAMSYKKAPFFDMYAEFFEDVYMNKKWQYLCELNDYMLRWFLKILNIETTFYDASNHAFKGKKNDLVLDMCTQMKADVYIFGAMGKDYADIDAFTTVGIEPMFQEYKHPEYSQLHGEFISHLSIVDLLFNHGPDSLNILMSNNLSKENIK